jgi:hypothetical protein
MQYLLLIYESESNRGNVDRAKLVEEYGKFTKSIIESGNFKGGDGLQPTSTATTVRVKDGNPLVSLKNFTLPVTLTCSLRIPLCERSRCDAPSRLSRRANERRPRRVTAPIADQIVEGGGGRSFARPACA